MPLDAVNSGEASQDKNEFVTAYPLIEKAINKVDSGDLPPYYAADLQVFRKILADIVGEPGRDSADLTSLKAKFATALETSVWLRKAELVRTNQSKSGPNLELDAAAEKELHKNLEFLLRHGLPGLFKGIHNNLYHNYSHCRQMSRRTLSYIGEFDVQLSPGELQVLRVGLVGHDGAHSGVLGPPDLEHNVQYAVKLLYLFMDYCGFTKQQIGFAIEKGVLPTVSFNSEFVPQDALGVGAELGDLAFEIELPHFLSNSLNVLKEQIPSIIAPPETVTDWLRRPVRDGFIGTYLETRVAELSQIPGTSSDTFKRLKKWMSHIQKEISELADHEERNQALPAKFEFFGPIKEQALVAITAQKEQIDPSKASLSGYQVMRRNRRSLFWSLENGLAPEGSARLQKKLIQHN